MLFCVAPDRICLNSAKLLLSSQCQGKAMLSLSFSTTNSNYYELTLCKQEQSFLSMCPLYLAVICDRLIQLIWKSETQNASVLL